MAQLFPKHALRAMRGRLDPQGTIVDGMRRSEHNGDRLFGPPANYIGPEPPFGCEVFVRRLPKNICEFELSALFERVGRVYLIRIRMDKSYHPNYRNFGAAFVQYFTPEDAERAVDTLDNCCIRQKRRIRVTPCINKTRLYIGNVPKEATRDEILAEMKRITPGVARLIIPENLEHPTLNHGFVFVEYDNHRFAMLAYRILRPKTTANTWGVELSCGWAKDTPIYYKLIVNNLPQFTTKETVMEMFNENSNDGVKAVFKVDRLAHVVMKTLDQARQAIALLDKTCFLGLWLDVQLSTLGRAELERERMINSNRVERVNFIRFVHNPRQLQQDLMNPIDVVESGALMTQFPPIDPDHALARVQPPMETIPINLPPVLQVRRDLIMEGIQQGDVIYPGNVIREVWGYNYVYPTVYVANVNNGGGSMAITNGGVGFRQPTQQLPMQFPSYDVINPFQQYQ